MRLITKYGPYKIITVSFIMFILIGSLLLRLPISHNEENSVSLIDAFFTTVSAICVTGLSTVDIAEKFNLFGITVIAILIQIGGLGIVCAAAGIITLSSQKIGIRERILIRNSLNLNSLKGIVKFVRKIIKITFTVELIGALLCFIVFINDYPFFKAIEMSIFHSISSFNNAGFDIIGRFKSLTDYNSDILLNLVTMALIIIGGLGFVVISDILNKKKLKKLSLHSKIVIKTTFWLIVIGTLLLKICSDMTILESLFLSVSTRTAGFNTYPTEILGGAALVIAMILMFIGASPSSTGGGIKTTTFYTLLKSNISICTNKRCNSFKRTISQDVINKSFTMLFSAITVVVFGVILLSIFEPDIALSKVMFECISAFGTVGLSTGITVDLSVLSKITLTILMFIGRLGPLTLLAIWSKDRESGARYPEENIMIG